MEAATKIQSATKQYLLKKRYYCTNDTDPYTLEKISDIEQLYIFKIVEGNSIHCFDIREMYKQYTTRNEKLFNPFTRRELEEHEINRFLVALTTLSNLGLKISLAKFITGEFFTYACNTLPGILNSPSSKPGPVP